MLFRQVNRALSPLAPSCSPGAEQLACAHPERYAPHDERRLAPEPELGEPPIGVPSAALTSMNGT